MRGGAYAVISIVNCLDELTLVVAEDAARKAEDGMKGLKQRCMCLHLALVVTVWPASLRYYNRRQHLRVHSHGQSQLISPVSGSNAAVWSCSPEAASSVVSSAFSAEGEAAAASLVVSGSTKIMVSLPSTRTYDMVTGMCYNGS